MFRDTPRFFIIGQMQNLIAAIASNLKFLSPVDSGKSNNFLYNTVQPVSKRLFHQR